MTKSRHWAAASRCLLLFASVGIALSGCASDANPRLDETLNVLRQLSAVVVKAMSDELPNGDYESLDAFLKAAAKREYITQIEAGDNGLRRDGWGSMLTLESSSRKPLGIRITSGGRDRILGNKDDVMLEVIDNAPNPRVSITGPSK